jgi:hypothetical protein
MLTYPRFRCRSGLGARPSVADGYFGIPETTGKVLMADLLDSIRQQLRERLDELRPLMSEYERLVEAERALRPEGPRPKSNDGGSRRRPRPQSRRGGSRSTTSTPSARAANREKVLAVIAERPGVTKAELQESSGLSGAGVAQNLRRLVGRGEVREESLPGGQTGYRRR